MWFDKNHMDNEGPILKKELYETYIQSWKKHHPTFQYMFWNKRKIEELWNKPMLHDYKPIYNKMFQHIEKCDLTRYAIMYCYGGFYADLDFKCLRSVEPLQTREILLAYEVHENCRIYLKLFNGMIASIPNHSLWLSIMNFIDHNYIPRRLASHNTGPAMLANFSKIHDLRNQFPDYFIDSCLIIPYNGYAFTPCIAKQCLEKYGSEENVLQNAYCYTKWHEGTFWGNGNMVSFMMDNYGTEISIILFFLILIIMLILIRIY